MNVSQMNTSELVSAATVLIENSLNTPEILSDLSPRGYDADALNSAKSIVQNIGQLTNEQQVKKSNKVSATRTFHEKRKLTHKLHVRVAGYARIIFKQSPEILYALGLKGNHSKAFPAWSERVRRLFQIALETDDIKTAFANVGVTEAELQNGLTLLNETIAAYNAREDKSGLSQQATRERTVEIIKLRSFMKTCVPITRIALADKPHYLERLGL